MLSLLNRLDTGLRLAMPAASTIIMCLASVVAWPLPYIGSVVPSLGFMGIYYWTCHRPDLLSPFVVFVIGLINDIVNDLPLGLSALLFTVAYQILLRQRRIFTGHSFVMLWSGFALASIGLMLTQWLLITLLHWQAVPLVPVFLQSLLSVAVFPLPCWLLIRLQRLLPVTD